MKEPLPSNGPSSNKPPSRLIWALLALLSLATAAVFWGALQADLVQWDDDANIYLNPHIQGLNGANLQWMLTDAQRGRRYMPLTYLSWAANYQWGGLNPFGYHLGNVVLHALNAVLVFLLIRKLLMPQARAEVSEDKQKQILWCSALGALLWAVHPLRVEPVAWASGRGHCQAIFLLLLSLLCYLQFAGLAPDARGRRAIYWLSVVAFAASLLTYPLAIGYVAVLVVLDFHPLRRLPAQPGQWWGAPARRVWLEKLPFAAVLVPVMAVTMWALLHDRGVWAPSVSLEQFGVLPRVLQGFYIWNYCAWKLWVPLDLSPVYTTLVGVETGHGRLWWSVVAVLALSALLIGQRKRWPAGLAMWACHLALLVPVLGLTEHPHYPCDRYSYLVNVLWSVLLAAGLWKCWGEPKRRAVALSAGLGMAVLLGTMSVRQTRIWQDNMTLFQYVLAKLGDDPYRAVILEHLASVLIAQGKLGEAIQHCELALQLKPDLAEAHYYWGVALAEEGKLKEALEHYERALQLKTEFAELHNNLAIVSGKLGKLNEAIHHFERALQLNPDYVDAHNNLAIALAAQGRWKEAIQHHERALQLKPDLAVARINLGNALTKLGKVDEAIQHYERTLQLNPDFAEAHYNLGNAMAGKGKLNEAIQHYERTIQLKPDLADVYYNLGMVLAGQGRLKEALAHFQQALDLATAQANPALVERIQAQLRLHLPASSQPQDSQH